MNERPDIRQAKKAMGRRRAPSAAKSTLAAEFLGPDRQTRQAKEALSSEALRVGGNEPRDLLIPKVLGLQSLGVVDLLRNVGLKLSFFSLLVTIFTTLT